MHAIDSRTRLALRWSTAPRHVGYASGHETNDLESQAPDFVGTPRQVDAKIQEVRRNVGQGTFLAILAILVSVKTTGERVDMDTLREIVHGY